MSSEFGSLLKISVFGQSHGRAIGVVVDGLPAGEAIDLEELNAFLARRKPGKSPLSTARREADAPVFLSGLENGVTCGAPLCAVIENGDQHSSDYDALQDKPRPGHADYTAFVKWGGQADMRGGGHFSGRLTAPLCIAGGIAKQILSRRGVYVGAHLQSVGTVADALFPLQPTKELFDAVAAKPFPVLDDQAGERMQALILEARKNLDSVGGVVECAATGLPAGLGEPMFGGVENRLAAALFGIPAVKGVEFGDGFAAARSHVDHIVRIFDHIQVVFNDDNGRTVMKKRLKDAQQNLHIQRMQPDRRLIKHKHRIRLSFSHFAGKFQPLCLSAGKARCFLAQRQIAQSQIFEHFQPLMHNL